MKKDLYQFLGSFLTIVMLVADFGAVAVKAAPVIEQVSEVESPMKEDAVLPDQALEDEVMAETASEYISVTGDTEHTEDIECPVFSAVVSSTTTTTASISVIASGLSDNIVTVGVILTDDMSVPLGSSDIASEDMCSSLNGDADLRFEGDGTMTVTLGNVSPLKPGTTYQYRLFIYDGEPAYGYPFVTEVATFTTASPPVVQSHVSIEDVSVGEYGFEAERIAFHLNNPNNETITSIKIVNGSGSSIGEVSENTAGSAYEAVFPTSAQDPAIRVSVSTGGGKTVSHTLSSDEIRKQDVSKRMVALSGKGAHTAITANAKLTPCYDIDRYMARLNYKKSSDTIYSQKEVPLLSINGGEGEISVSDLEADTDYQYYITVFSAYDESHIVDSCGSAAEPLTFHTEKTFSILPNSVYNRKQERFEFVFNNDFPQGTKVNAEIVSYDAELKSYTVMAAASTSIVETAPVVMRFRKNDGRTYKANDGDVVYFRFYIGDKSVTPDPLQLKVRYFDEMTSIKMVSGNSPFTLRFYSIAEPGTLINTVHVRTKKDDSYFLGVDDVLLLDPENIYTCIISDSNGQITGSVSGYFTSDPKHFRDQSKNVPLKSLKIKGATAMEVGERQRLLVEFTPADVTDKSVSWNSSNPEVASISSDGIVSANKVGYTTITVESGDGKKSDSIVLCVIDKNESLYVEFAEDEEYIYTGEKITPAVNVYHHGKRLAEGVDYKVSYSNNINAGSEAKLTVTGVTIPGKVVKTFTIYRRQIDDDMVKAAELIVISGKTASPVLYLGNYKLCAKDYTYDSKRKFTQSELLVISGKGNFKGSRKLTVTIGMPKTLKVKSFNPVSRTYNGENQYISDKELIVVDSKSGETLKENEDYILSYQPDVCSAGTVKFSIIGIGSYNTTLKKTYKIQALKASGVSVNVIDKQPYNPVNNNAPVEVTYKGKKLIAGQDYKVSYQKNKAVGKAEVTVSFIGNYKGTSGQKKNYKITQASISANNVNIFCADMAWTKDAKLISTPYVTMDGGEVPKANYSVKYTISGNEITKRKVTQADFGGNSSVTVTVTLEGKSNMTGKAECTYRIFKIDNGNDLSKAKVEIKKINGKSVSSIPYNGLPIKINGDYHLVVTLNGKVLTEGKDYTVDYANNIYKGKASVIVTGLGDDSKEETKYYGSKAKTFTITKGTLASF